MSTTSSHIVVSVYDTKTAAYHPPMVFSTRPEACRFMEQLMRRTPDHPYTQFPADYILYDIGTWDSSTAALAHNNAPVELGRLDQFSPPDRSLYADLSASPAAIAGLRNV